MVDRSNLPMWINTVHGTTADHVSANGCVPAGCISPCARLKTDQCCCRGRFAPRADCDPRKWPVDYALVFKRAEPYAYSYSDDDATSTFTCSGGCDYRITFGLSRRRR